MSAEAKTHNVINKINNKLKFFHRKNSFLTSSLRHLLCNALIRPHFDYACSTWFPNLTKKIKHRIQTTQNKSIRFCLQLDNLKHISHEDFERLNWLYVTYRFKQCFNSIVFKYFNEQFPYYLSEVVNVATKSNIQLRGSFRKLKCPFRKTNNGQFALSYIGPTFAKKPGHIQADWKKISEADFLCLNLFSLSTIPSLFLSMDFNFEKHNSLLLGSHNVNTNFY